MKKIFLFLCLGLLLTSCGNTPEPNSQTGANTPVTTSGASDTKNTDTPDSEVKKLISDFAEYLGHKDTPINALSYEFREFFESKAIPAYQLKITGVGYEALQDMMAEKYLDGWVAGNYADGMAGYSVEYARDNIVCQEEAMLENPEIMDDLYALEDSEDIAKKEDAILAKRKYQYTFTCAEKPKDAISLIDIHFEAFGGGGMTPAWNLYLNQHILELSVSELEGSQRFFIDSIKKTANGYDIEASYDGKMSLKLEKKPCSLYTDPET